MIIKDTDIWMLRDALLGTCMSIHEGMEQVKIPSDSDITYLESRLAEEGIERCQSCDWWCESFELAPNGDTDEGEGLCSDCKNEE